MALKNDAQSSFGTYLMKYDPSANSNAGEWDKFIDIIDYSDLEEQPETIDITTLSDDTETTISGIKRLGSGVSFSVLVKPSEFIAKRDEAEDKEITEFALWFYNGAYDAAAKSAFNATPAQGETDDRFAVYFVGTFSIVQNGAGVDEALKATLTIYPQKTPSTGKVMNYERPSHLA